MASSRREVPPDKTSIAGTVTSAQGDPLARVVVLITGDSPSHPDIAAVTDNQGRYRFDGLLPGAYSLLANAAGLPMQMRRVEAAGGQAARLDFVLDR